MATHNTPAIEELRQKYVGVESSRVVVEVEKGAIKSFAEAIDDPNSLWNDEAQARSTRYGGIIAPPTFLRSLRAQHPEQLRDLPQDRLLDGGSEWEYFHPVRPGDQITGVTSIVDISDRAGRLGQMLFIITETRYTNQFDELVATQKSTSIKY